MPYIGPDMSYSLPTEADGGAPQRVRPDIIFMPFGPMEEEPDIAVTKNGVGLTGSAAMGKVGSSFGLVDIGEFEDSYLFRVSLPGAARDESKLQTATSISLVTKSKLLSIVLRVLNDR